MAVIDQLHYEPLDTSDAGLFGGWLRIPDEYLSMDLSPREFRLLMHILWRIPSMRGHGTFWETNGRTAKSIGFSRRAVIDTLRALEAKGVLQMVGYMPSKHGSSVKRWRPIRLAQRRPTYTLVPRWMFAIRSPMPVGKYLSDNALRLLVQLKHWGKYDPHTHRVEPFDRTNQQWADACNMHVRTLQYAKREIEEYFR